MLRALARPSASMTSRPARAEAGVWAPRVVVTLALTLPLPLALSPGVAGASILDEGESGGSFKAAHDAYARGRGMFEVADYDGAIKAFARAYQLLPTTPEHDGRRRIILRDLVYAHLKAYRIDRDVTHLRIARDQLERYRAALGTALPEERREAEALGREIEAQLVLAEAEAELAAEEAAKRAAKQAAKQAAEEAAAAAVERSEAELREDLREELRKELAADAGATPEGPRSPPAGPSMLDIGDPLERPEVMIGAGGVLVGLGAVATGFMVYSAVRVNQALNQWSVDYAAGGEAIESYHDYYPILIALAVQGPALLATGSALLAVGIKRKRLATFSLAPSYRVTRSPSGRRARVLGVGLQIRM